MRRNHFFTALFISTTLTLAGHQHLHAQAVTTEEPPTVTNSTPGVLEQATPGVPEQATPGVLEQATPDLSQIPHAIALPPAHPPDHVVMESDIQSRHDDTYTLSGDVVLTFRDRILKADVMTYNDATGDITLQGHVHISGGDNDEEIYASHGTYNLHAATGRFYDVSGSVGLRTTGTRVTYESENPVLFNGRLVVKTGPDHYDIYDGSVTSCLLPKPDWQFSSSHFSLSSKKVRATNSTFRLVGVPIVYLPFVTLPVDPQARQSGLLVPSLEPHSNTKGTVIGDEVYLALGRSADITLGVQYLSLRGYGESGTIRYRGIGNDFASAHVTALQDCLFRACTGTIVNQGGEDVTGAFRKKLTKNTRIVGDGEYLSSFIYREAFTENFNQAVSSDINSIAYAMRQQYGYAASIRFDRYQGLKRVPITTVSRAGVTTTQPGQEVHILHVPSFDFTAIDHRIGRTPLLWSLESSAAGLKRVQPNFTSSGIIERFDLRPEISLPLSGDGWHTMTSVAVRNTIYSRSRNTPYGPNTAPRELTDPVNRASLEVKADIRPPVIERDFHPPALVAKLLGPEIRHTIEPQLVYRNTSGIGNTPGTSNTSGSGTFFSILRFDDLDLDSNTNELEYGVTQHIFARSAPSRKVKPCAAAKGSSSVKPDLTVAATAVSTPVPFIYEDDRDDEPAALDANGIPTVGGPPKPTASRIGKETCPPAEAPEHEWLSWRIAQKHFFDPTFGNAVINTRRNLFDSTLNFSGIAFLTEPRDISPLLSRLRLRTSSHLDVEWDFDLDTGAKKFTSSNIFLDGHAGSYFGALAYARLNAPGRSIQYTIDNNGLTSGAVGNANSDYQQLRLLAGYGNESKPGLSLAANANIDLNNQQYGALQYGALQAGYNWNCCGISVEYRKYDLGPVRNESTERFSFTLVNIGTAGNLRRSERLF